MAAISELNPTEFRAAIPSLARLLVDAVEGGASVGWPGALDHAAAAAWWAGLADPVTAGNIVVLVARDGTDLVGTVQLRLAEMPNQLHRADVAKLLVLRRHRRAGIGSALMSQLEQVALGLGRHLLVLDTLSGSPAEAFYLRLGWIEVGPVPGYALLPGGDFGATTFFYRDLAAVNSATG